jgi:ABC-type uncharacterized transport system permease subunit
MDPLTNPAFLLFAFFSPLLISLLKQAGLSPQVNALIAQVAYIVIGVAAVVVSGTPITMENAVQLSLVATVVGSAAYNLVWSNLGVATAGQASLEERLVVATSLKK